MYVNAAQEINQSDYKITSILGKITYFISLSVQHITPLKAQFRLQARVVKRCYTTRAYLKTLIDFPLNRISIPGARLEGLPQAITEQ